MTTAELIKVLQMLEDAGLRNLRPYMIDEEWIILESNRGKDIAVDTAYHQFQFSHHGLIGESGSLTNPADLEKLKEVLK
jgi:hypothetical protein